MFCVYCRREVSASHRCDELKSLTEPKQYSIPPMDGEYMTPSSGFRVEPIRDLWGDRRPQ